MCLWAIQKRLKVTGGFYNVMCIWAIQKRMKVTGGSYNAMCLWAIQKRWKWQMAPINAMSLSSTEENKSERWLLLMWCSCTFKEILKILMALFNSRHKFEIRASRWRRQCFISVNNNFPKKFIFFFKCAVKLRWHGAKQETVNEQKTKAGATKHAKYMCRQKLQKKLYKSCETA